MRGCGLRDRAEGGGGGGARAGGGGGVDLEEVGGDGVDLSVQNIFISPVLLVLLVLRVDAALPADGHAEEK